MLGRLAQTLRTGVSGSSLTGTLLLASATGAMFAADIASAQALEEIIVTARKREENIQNIPVAMTAITGEQLDQYSLRSMEQIAASTPQLTVVRGSNGSGASLSLRGIGSSYTSIGIEQSVAVNVDGVYYGQGRIINEGFFDMKQVEILKGPQALFFGKNASSGVVSFTSANPGKEFEALARVGYEFDSKTPSVEAMVSGPVTDTFGLRLAVRGSDMQGGYVANIAPAKTFNTLDLATFTPATHSGAAPERDVPAEQDYVGRLTAQFKPNDDLSVTLKGAATRYRVKNATWNTAMFSCPGVAAGVLGVGSPAIPAGVSQVNGQSCAKDWVIQQNDIPADVAAANPLTNRHGGRLYQDYDSYSFTGDVGYNFGAANLSAVAGYHHFTNYFLGDYDYSGALNGGTWGAERSEYDALSTEVRLQTAFNGPVNFMVGGYFQTTQLDFHQLVFFPGGYEMSNLADPSLRYVTVEKLSRTDGDTYAGFAQVMWKFAPQWEFTTGARYTNETKDSFFKQPYVIPAYQAVFVQGTPLAKKQKFTDFSPEAALTWKPSDDLTIYAAYKQGYKSGGFSGSALYSVNTTVNDLAFNPEEAEGFEVGLKTTALNGGLRFNVNVYSYKYTDLQIDFFDSAKIQFVTLNAGASRTEGIEADVEWAAAGGLVLRANAAYNKARYLTFNNAPCYAGQSQQEGCLPGARPTQDLGGKATANAPKLTGALGADYKKSLGSVVMGLSANLRYSDSYFLSSFSNPLNKQGSFSMIDAALRFGSDKNTWEVALIGKNLTDKFVLNSGQDAPSSGGNTGGSLSAPVATTRPYRADLAGTVNLPRTFALQLTTRF